MKSRRSNTINLAIVLFGILAILMPQVHAQTSKEPYAVMAPLAEYLMADRPAEIQLVVPLPRLLYLSRQKCWC